MEEENRKLKEQVIVLKQQLEEQRSEYYNQLEDQEKKHRDQLTQLENKNERTYSTFKAALRRLSKMDEDNKAKSERITRLKCMLRDTWEDADELRKDIKAMKERRKWCKEIQKWTIEELKASKREELKNKEQRFMAERGQFQSRQTKVFEMMDLVIKNSEDIVSLLQDFRTEQMDLMSMCREESPADWRTKFSSLFQRMLSGIHEKLHKLSREWKAMCHFGMPSCQICNFEFCSEIPERTARSLHCGHTLCQHCAQKMFEGVTIKCPFDRREAVVESGDASDLPKNFTVMELMDVWKRQ